jgi:hypothetical protein
LSITCPLNYTRLRKSINKGNAKHGISPCLKIWPWDLDLWPWKSIVFQILLRTKYVPSLVKIHWRMLILVFTRMLKKDGRTEGRTVAKYISKTIYVSFSFYDIRIIFILIYRTVKRSKSEWLKILIHLQCVDKKEY